MGTRLQIDILGPTPNEVDLKDLITILDDLRDAVTSCMDEDTAADKLGSRVSLVDIVEGSDGLIFEVQPKAMAALAQLSRALKSRNYQDLPTTAHAALYRVNQFVSKRAWGLRIRGEKAAGLEAVEMKTPEHVSAPETRRTISGTTTLLARCLRVGGAKTPTAELRIPNRKLLFVEVTEAVARELGKRLYDEVVLSGDAIWDARDGDLKQFRVSAVEPFRKLPVNIAFKELSTASNGRWNNVDAAEFVQHVRGSDE